MCHGRTYIAAARDHSAPTASRRKGPVVVSHVTDGYTCHKLALTPLLAEVRWRVTTLSSSTIGWIERTTTRWLTPNHAWQSTDH